MAKILIIEDELPYLEEVSDVLKYEGFEVLEASDGLTGLQLALGQHPDLIICDILLPELNGYEVLGELRRNLATATTPFVFLTAKSDQEDLRQGMQLGADDYLTKPIGRTELLAALSTQLEKRALAEAQQLRSFSRRLVEIQEAERLRIAHLLEDHIGDALAGLSLTFSATANLPPAQLPVVLSEVQKQIEKVMSEVSAISLEFYPSMLEHLGLLPALLWLFGRIAEQTTLQIDFKHAELDQAQEPQVKLIAYRIIQEAIANIVQHAAATHVTIRAWCEDDLLHVEIKDDGVGFEVETTVRSGQAAGLTSMYERAASFGGKLTIMSAPRSGATVVFEMPLKKQPAEAVNLLSKHPVTDDLQYLAGTARVFSSELDHQNTARGSQHMTTIIVAEGSDMVRQGLLWLLNGEPDFEVLGEISHGQGVVTAVENLNPDILILDFMMPGLNGIEIVRRVRKSAPEVRVFVLSTFKGEGYVLEALRSGAMGYALKSNSADELAAAVRQIATGERYVSPTISKMGIEAYIEALNSQMETPDPYETLTEREREVLHLVAEGRTNPEIAELLLISPRTAETHRSNMFRKLGFNSQADAIRFAIKRGIVAIGDETP